MASYAGAGRGDAGHVDEVVVAGTMKYLDQDMSHDQAAGMKIHLMKGMDFRPLVDKEQHSMEDTRSMEEGMSFEEAGMRWKMAEDRYVLVVPGTGGAGAHGCQLLVEVCRTGSMNALPW